MGQCHGCSQKVNDFPEPEVGVFLCAKCRVNLRGAWCKTCASAHRLIDLPMSKTFYDERGQFKEKLHCPMCGSDKLHYTMLG